MKAEPSLKRSSLVFRRYLRLLLILFAIEFLVDSALHLLMPLSSKAMMSLVDGLAMAICSTPLIWWLVVQPLRKDFSAEKARFDQVIDQVIDSIVLIDYQGRIEAFNTAAELTFGYREEEVLGLQPVMLVEEPAGYLQEILAQAASGQVPTDCIHHEIIGRRHDGSRFPMSISVSWADLGDRSSLILIIRDISPIKEQELRQQRMLSLLEATLDATADAIVAVDWQRSILTYNQRLAELFDVPADILEARDSLRLASYLQGLVEDPETFQARLEALYRQPDTTSFDVLRFRDGRIMERSSHPQLLNGRSIGRVWSFRDITDRSRSEEELRRSEERFRSLATSAPVGIFETDATGRWNSFNRWGLFAAVPYFGFGAVTTKTGAASLTDYRLSLGFGDRTLGFGIAYAFSGGDKAAFDRRNSWTVGALVRPVPHLSLGLIGTTTGGGERSEGVADLGIRPFGTEAVTLFADYAIQNYERLRSGAWSTGAALEPLAGIRITGRYFDTHAFSLGVSVSLGNAGLSTQSTYDSDARHAFNTYAIRLGAFDRTLLTKLARDSRYVALDLNGPMKYQRHLFFDDASTLRGTLTAIEAAKTDETDREGYRPLPDSGYAPPRARR